MSTNGSKDDLLQPTTLQEAINTIKFLKLSHKQEVVKLRDVNNKQAEIIKKLESNRKKELEYLSCELQKYELNLALRTESVKSQLQQKDDEIDKQREVIDKQQDIIERLTEQLIIARKSMLVESNSDSGIAMENDDLQIKKREQIKPEAKPSRKCSRRFADPISFLRRVDFSPMKYKPCKQDGVKKKEDKKKTLEVPCKNESKYSNEKHTSDEDTRFEDTSILTDTDKRTEMINGSMNNYFFGDPSEDTSEDTSEEIFDRVMTRSSIRRSVKANPKYKKISRTKSKMLEQVKVNIIN